MGGLCARAAEDVKAGSGAAARAVGLEGHFLQKRVSASNAETCENSCKKHLPTGNEAAVTAILEKCGGNHCKKHLPTGNGAS